jgi:predicted dienelactone hydrolase
MAHWVLSCCVLLLVADDKPADYRRTGPNEVEAVEMIWKDAKRDREMPLRIYSPKDGKGPFPVIVFSHGLGGTAAGYEYLGRHWASYGYVSVHIQHHGSDDAVWKDSKTPLADMKKAAADPKNAIDRPLDVRFTLDQLTELNKDSKSLKGRLDLERVGMAGHSFGAYTTLAVAGETFITAGGKQVKFDEPRVKAAIAMSSSPGNNKEYDKVFGSIKIPILHMTGTKDETPIADTKPEARRIPFDHITRADQYLIVFKDGDHMIFSGRPRLPAGANADWQKLLAGGEKDADFQKLILASSTAFWDAYLKDDAKAKSWLAEGDLKKMLGEEGSLEVKKLK